MSRHRHDRSSAAPYTGSPLRWHLRPLRRLLHPPVARFRHQGLSPTDVVIGSYPRSGSTWITFMLADLFTGTEVDFSTVQRVAPGVGRHHESEVLPTLGGRLLRTHERWRSEYRRAVYIVRDPRDVVVSYYEYRRWLREFDGTLDAFVRSFVRGRIDAYGPWSGHVRSWCHRSDVTILRYEAVRIDAVGSILSVAKRLGIGSSREVERVVHRASFANAQEREHAARRTVFQHTGEGRFVRAGRVGEWRERLSDDSRLRIESTFGETMHLMGYDPLDTADFRSIGP